MNRMANLFGMLGLAALLVVGGAFVHAAEPLGQGKPLPQGPSASAAKLTPQRFEVQCPSAYSGLKGELLPTYWEPVDKGQAVQLIKSQVQGQSLYCVYRIPSAGRDVHASIRRLLPQGYGCVSDGAGRFECDR